MKLDPPIRLHDLPIPPDARPTRRWPELMREMADHIGAYRTLLVVDHLGGQEIYVPLDPEQNRLAAIIDADGATIMSRIYGKNRLSLPVAREVLSEARRAPVIAAVRAGKLSVAEAVPILGIDRKRLSRLINRSDEGAETNYALDLRPRRRSDTNQLDLFETDI